MACRTRHDAHQVDGGGKKPGQAFGGDIDRQPVPEMWLLRGDADRTVVGVARTHAETADSLQRRVGHGNAVGAQRHRLGKIRRMPQPARDDQRDAVGVTAVKMAPGPGKRRDRRHRDVVPENQWRSARPSSTPVENDVIDADLERRIDVLLDVLGR